MLAMTEHPTVQGAREAIARVRQAGAAYALRIAAEAALLREKPAAKAAAIGRLMATENGLTGRAHSCTSAEAIVEMDPAFHDFCRRITEATCEREMSRTELIAARLEAQLGLALVLGDD